jgi:Delta7-sterol 5-desaturase
VIGHSGYEIFPARADGRPLFDWMTTVTHHDLHHAQAGWNFGLYFTWWDRWMGTEHPEYYERFAAAAGRWATKPAAATLAAIATLGIGLTMAGSPGQSRAETLGIHGLWATQGFGAIVDIGPCEGAPDKACGRIVWLWEPGPLIGTLILQAFTETAPGIWRGGTVYNPDDGRSYSGSITLTEAGNLKLEGCALGIFCQTQQWRRPRDILQEVARLGL